MYKSILKLLAVLATAAPLAAMAAPILITSGPNGQLTGATNVDVNGTLYDVVFRDGRCSTLFDGCNSSDDFMFQDLHSARAASQALLNQVLVGIYDSHANRTLGCSYYSTCYIATPFGLGGWSSQYARVSFARNHHWNGYDYGHGHTHLHTNWNSSWNHAWTYAIWSRSTTTAVSEPGSLALFGLGLVLLSVRARRRASAARGA